MKGVLLKDLYIAKSNILVTIVSLIILGFGLSFLVETSALLVLAPVASTTAVFISIASDAGSKWNKNVITMPVSRNQIISEKFVFYILLAIVGLITALIPCIMLMLVGVAITVHSLCLYAAIGMSATLLAGGISLPCAYLFDPEKSQIVFMMSFMASTGIIVGLVLLTNLFIPVKSNILEESKRLDVSRTNEYTVAEWLRLWFELYSKPHVRPSTADYYRRSIERSEERRVGKECRSRWSPYH